MADFDPIERPPIAASSDRLQPPSSSAACSKAVVGILMFNRGSNCLVRLLVSLWSLRKWWRGPVSVFLEGDHPQSFVECARHLGADVINAEPSSSGNFVRKVEVCVESPFDRTLWLDSDTLICGKIDEIFQSLDSHQFVTPHFAHWHTDKRLMRARIAQYAGLCPTEWLDEAIRSHPAINAGVFAFRKDAQLMPEWLTLSRRGDGRVRLSDEIALQILLPRYDIGILPAKFNVSVKYPVEAEDPRIIHFHGRKHVRDFPLCERWKRAFHEFRASGLVATSDLSSWADYQLQRYLQRQPQVTVVTACDPVYVEKLRLTFPNWVSKKQITQFPIIVFVQGMGLSDSRLDFLRHPQVRLIPWEFPVTSQREKMLSAFVFGVAEHVPTRWWLKLDADAFATSDAPLLTEEMKTTTIFGHRWGYSFAEHIAALDKWAASHPKLKSAPMFDPSCVRGRRYYHRRTASFVQLEETEFTREAARLAGDRLPVPSQDTYIFYLTQCLGRSVGSTNFKKFHGMTNSSSLSYLQQTLGGEASSSRSNALP